MLPKPVRLLRLIAMLVALASLGLSSLVGADASSVLRSSPKAGRPCRGTVPPARYAHVIWFVFENQGYDQVVGNRVLPYTNRLARSSNR